MGYIYSRNAESQFYYQCTMHNIRDTEITPEREPSTESKQMQTKKENQSLQTQCVNYQHTLSNPVLVVDVLISQFFLKNWTSVLSYISEDKIVHTL